MTTSTEPANIHHASPESMHFLQEFSEICDDDVALQHTLQHPVRVADNVASFAGDFVPSRLYDVAILHEVNHQFETSTDPRASAAAKTVLQAYFGGLMPQELTYVSSVMADMPLSQEFANRFREAESFKLLSKKYGSILTPEYTGEVPEEVLNFVVPIPNLRDIATFAKNTNLEGHLVGAADKIDSLWLPPSTKMDSFLRLLSVQHFDVPELEIIGFDGMAMAGRDVSLRTKHEMLGNTAVLEKATELHNDARKISVEKMFAVVVGEENFELKHVVTDMGREPFVEIGDFEFTDPNGKRAAGKFRIKSIGSIAEKMQRPGTAPDAVQAYGVDDVPMDIFATTIIEKDVASSAEMFASMVDHLRDNSSVRLEPAKSKEKAFYAQGDENYLNRIKKALVEKGIDIGIVQFEPIDSKGYEVAKITFQLSHDGVTTPSEVQFVTEAKRHEARLGHNAHWARLTSGAEVDLESMESIYDRKSHMTPDPDSEDYLKVNVQSIERGISLVERVRS